MDSMIQKWQTKICEEMDSLYHNNSWNEKTAETAANLLKGLKLTQELEEEGGSKNSSYVGAGSYVPSTYGYEGYFRGGRNYRGGSMYDYREMPPMDYTYPRVYTLPPAYLYDSNSQGMNNGAQNNQQSGQQPPPPSR